MRPLSHSMTRPQATDHAESKKRRNPMSKPKAPRGPINPRVRGNLYGLAALYLVYLLYQIAKPYLTRDP